MSEINFADYSNQVELITGRLLIQNHLLTVKLDEANKIIEELKAKPSESPF